MKRIFDIIVCVVTALPATLICIFAIIAIIIETPGAPLFWQVRVGKGQKTFRLLKLRTMMYGTPQKGSHEVHATYITRVGRVLRRVKIDELPQIWNVLKGDMSIVGPRPNLPNQCELIALRAERGVYEVRPGITGPAQLSGIDMSTPIKLAEEDALYITQQSLIGDFKLIVKTALGNGSGDAVKD